MSLEAGHKLGPYEIGEPIGKGGMGEVYRARDTRLDRDVALKVLPDELAADSERVARFEREAKLLASLNHPNIASIYGFESGALVLELVEGPTLAERIAQAPLPIDEAIAIAKQIAEALEAGHEAGIVHRDLKPANIKLKEDGTVKVLDYGLAKAFEGDAAGGADSDLSHSPTLTRHGTQIGVILGTAAYMSPEQARGKKVDRRTDIWAWGVVLYEMVTGQMAFKAEDVSLTLAAVMTAEPDLSALPHSSPPVVETVIRRCLVKDPKERIRDIGDARLALVGAFETKASPVSAAGSTAGPPWRRALPVVAALVAATIVTAVAARALLRPATPIVARFDVTPEGGVTVLATSPSVALSPDGQTIAYMGGGEYTTGAEIRVRSLARLDTETLVADMVASPFFSPDGSQIGFYEFLSDPMVLKRASIHGGPSSIITTLDGALHGASWGTDGTIIYATRDTGSGLWQVPAGGGEAKQLTTPDADDGDHYWPEILPGGKAVLFTILGAFEEQSRIAVLSLATGEQTVLVRSGSFPRYSPTGHVLFGRAGALWVVPFDLDRLETRGDPVPVQEGVRTKGRIGATEVTLSENGTLLYVEGDERFLDDRRLVWVDATGREELALTPGGTYSSAALSPDGARAAMGTSRDGERSSDIWISDLARGTLERLTGDGGVNRNPLWSPDGQRIAYSSEADGLVWRNADGSGRVESLVPLEPGWVEVVPTSWSPDGTTLIVSVRRVADRMTDIGVVRVGDPESLRLLGWQGARSPALSPDGRWLAYASSETGNFEVYVQRFPEGGRRQAVSIGGGNFPKWSADGRSLTYVRSEGGGPLGVARVAVQGGGTQEDSLLFSTPTELFSWSYYSTRSGTRVYDMTSDGERFLMVEGDAASPARVILVQNWLEELKAKVPGP